MIIRKMDLVAVTGRPDQYPHDDLPEIAFAGRSNVGKSSLINLVLGRRNFARTSGNPGKTRTINFYEINGSFRIVDLPGYGYARVAKGTTEKWGEMIEAYLKRRNHLLKVVQLVDLRHPPSAQDLQMYEWLKFYNLDGIVVATKSDKISRNDIQKHKAMIRKALGMRPEDKLIAISSLKKTGYEEVLQMMDELLGEK